MSDLLKNVVEYCDHFHEEYRSVLERNYKEILDQAKKEKTVPKSFPLYQLTRLVPYCLMYDYGTWIFFVTL